ncbi:hypothetical protein KIN20_030692 [Parelaphostrongylus tenuis]|uniref:Uncharacterized protein n=1 Tax=Parelaphostrongylus tenuis TaxID=148309 RepID=A0AAD5WGA8_PARTN|nr:hypothetical protein KIN20_030692 [Parelaphostrongylus tenuis]
MCLKQVTFYSFRLYQMSFSMLACAFLLVLVIERKQCSAIPEISSDLQELLTVDSTAFNIPDEVFLMEMRTAGRLEQDSQDTICCGEEIDITDECIFGIDEDEDENEDVSDENDEGEQLSSESDPSQVNPISTPATKPELLSKLSVDSTDCTRKGRNEFRKVWIVQ